MATPRRTPSRKAPLSPGDNIELAVTISGPKGSFSSVKAGATTTIRPGESVRAAYNRVETLVIEVAERVLEDIA